MRSTAFAGLALVVRASPCVRVTTGTGAFADGTLDVGVESGDGSISWKASGFFGSGAVVYNACDGTTTVQVRNPTGNGWIGSIEYTADGATYEQMICTVGCTSQACTQGSCSADGRLCVDGDSACATFAPAACGFGATCTFVAPIAPPPAPPPNPWPPGRQGALLFSKTEIDMGVPLARTRPWTLRPSGQCGSQCDTLRRIHSASCGGDRLLVAWTAHTGWKPDVLYGPEGARDPQGLFEEVSVGHIAEYSIDPTTSTAKLVVDTEIPWCNEMGGITATADCSIVGALCRSALEADAAGAFNFVTAEGRDANPPFGWSQTSNADTSSEHYRIIEQMYLLEWSQGSVGQTALPPTAKVQVSHSIGGWNYGSFALSINAAATTYAIDLKTTIFGGGTWHEGSTQFAIDRPSAANGNTWPLNSALSQGWACGFGHVQMNRLIYNNELDKWGRYCWTDGCYKRASNPDASGYGMSGACFGTFFGTIPKHDVDGQLHGKDTPQLHAEPNPATVWSGNGGPTSIVSRGADGFLAVTHQTDESGDKLTVGIAALPADQSECNDGSSPCTFHWLTPSQLASAGHPDFANTYPREDTGRRRGPIGFANLARIGNASNERFLVGWADDVQAKGVAKRCACDSAG